MKLNNKFEIKEIPFGYRLEKEVIRINKETKESYKDTEDHYYGTMEQALVGFVNHSIEDPETLDELKVKVESIRELIVSLKAEIVAERGVIRDDRTRGIGVL